MMHHGSEILTLDVPRCKICEMPMEQMFYRMATSDSFDQLGTLGNHKDTGNEKYDFSVFAFCCPIHFKGPSSPDNRLLSEQDLDMISAFPINKIYFKYGRKLT